MSDDDDESRFFSRGNSSDVNSRILLIAIISLSVVVVFVTMLHVYARYILRRRAALLQGVGIIVHIEPPKRGLEPMVIASLPILMYKDMNHHEQGLLMSPECTICLGVFEGDQMIRTLPDCKHHFHAECIDKWLGSHSSCPVCRNEVDPCATILPLPREPSTSVGPSAPPLDTHEVIQSSAKVNETNSRLSSFRRMLSMDRSSRRVNSSTQDNGPNEDLERQ